MTTNTLTMQDDFLFLVDDLYTLISRLKNPDLKKNDNRSIQMISIECEKMSALFKKFSDYYSTNQQEISRMSVEVSQRLEEYSKHLNNQTAVKNIKLFWRDLAASYEILIQKISKANINSAQANKSFPSLRPVNYWRNIFHMGNGLLAIILYQFVLTHNQALIVLGTLFTISATMEITRKFSDKFSDFLTFKVFGLVSHPRERYKVNSATYYTAGLVLTTWLVGQIPLMVAIIILAFGDPMANIMGKRFGKLKIYKQKSLIGSLSFFLTSFILTSLFCIFFKQLDWALYSIIIFCGTLSFLGSVIEIFSSKIDDNFSIVVGCGLIAQLWFI